MIKYTELSSFLTYRLGDENMVQKAGDRMIPKIFQMGKVLMNLIGF